MSWEVKLEFEFNETGGRSVAAQSLVSILQGQLARGQIDSACRLYEDEGTHLADELLAAVAIDSSQT
jgi:hypothetical protein